jgi:hypothetical protein
MGNKFTMSTGQAHELALAFGRNGWTNADVKKLSEGDMLARLLPVIKGEAQIAVPADPIFKVEVDYGLTLAEMIMAGKYDWTSSNITPEHFPIQGEGRVERELTFVHFNKVMTTDEVLAELDRRGLRPGGGKIEELLALGAKFPDLQRQFPIVAIGSSFVGGGGFRSFACLYWLGGERHLGLAYVVDDWSEGCRFLAARK